LAGELDAALIVVGTRGRTNLHDSNAAGEALELADALLADDLELRAIGRAHRELRLAVRGAAERRER
jgi:hypothetical protein